MRITKRLLSLLLAVIMVFAMAACNRDGNNETTGAPAATTPGESGSYSVSVKTVGGMAMEGIDVYVYADSTMTDMVQYGKTDANGVVSFTMPKKEGYAVTLSGVPDGYDVQTSYAFSGSAAVITLTSSLITDKELSGASLGLGDVMYDFEITTPQGQTYKLSEILKEKKLVVLNFWYTGCSWCVTEFPFMEQAYQTFGEDVEILALDPMGESNDAIAAFPASQGLELSFPMAACPTAWASGAFGVTGYPTSVFIDRYGVICAIEAGAITSLRPFTCAFEHFTADDYQQKLCVGGVADLVSQVKPTYEAESPEDLAALLNQGDIQATYHGEEDEESAEYSWPFIITEKNGEKCVMASNAGIDEAFAILYADVELKAGQALGFDYLTSSELGADILYVIVDDELIYSISGVGEEEVWQTAYPCVADQDGTYEIALCYMKDSSGSEGDDTVYIKNMRIAEVSEIDTPTYLSRPAAKTEDDFEYTYVDIVYSEKDGYYHVGDANGPLLLVDLMGTTAFNEEQSIWNLCYDGTFKLDGKDYTEALTQYCNYASNTKSTTLCTVNQELYDLLTIVDEIAGFDSEDKLEWLRACKYYQAYGTNGEQMSDPIAGLATFSAFLAKEGKNVETNFFYYDRIIMPRGMMAEFTPSRSGVYRITSRANSTHGVEGWIFNKDRQELYTYEHSERMWGDTTNVSMLFYMEAGQPYYIDIAFWDVYEVGYIYYDIEYVGTSYEPFVMCSPGYFTYDSDATGDAMYYLITEGPKVILHPDGYYYEDLGKDANGNQKYGSKIYCDFIGTTGLFTASTIATIGENKGMIDKGGFDFSKSSEDLEILSYLAANDGDVEATRAYLRQYWGSDYDAQAEIYQLEDVLKGIYHGEGEDLTEEMRSYLSKQESTGERKGCVAVDKRLAELLQMLVDKYSFSGVENSWLKLCYYYDYIGK